MKLSKSQRITFIQDIAGRMENDDWPAIDLILKQFSLPTSNEWSDSKKSYILQMISEARDTDLMELAEHFGIKGSDPTGVLKIPIETPYWQEGTLKVFLSHLSSERKQAADLQKALGKYGMSCFVAHNDIHPTREWQTEIEIALATCELLVALIHPEFINSQWCDQEIGYALGRGIPVFTVRCGADPHGFVSRFQSFNGKGKQQIQIAQELFDAAIRHKELQTKMADVLIELFVNSGSFAAAKARVENLEKITVWDPSYSKRLTKAVEDNSQIKGSWGVPAQVANLVAKWK